MLTPEQIEADRKEMNISYWKYVKTGKYRDALDTIDALRAKVAALETEAEKERKRGEEQIDYAQTVEARVAALEEAAEAALKWVNTDYPSEEGEKAGEKLAAVLGLPRWGADV